jgi:hypothetical protein
VGGNRGIGEATGLDGNNRGLGEATGLDVSRGPDEATGLDGSCPSSSAPLQ